MQPERLDCGMADWMGITSMRSALTLTGFPARVRASCPRRPIAAWSTLPRARCVPHSHKWRVVSSVRKEVCTMPPT
eukprot:3081752-Pyramimonas_sp.AAC.1